MHEMAAAATIINVLALDVDGPLSTPALVNFFTQVLPEKTTI